VSVATEPAHEQLQLLVHHGVVRYQAIKILLLLVIRQFAVQDQVADIHKVAVLSQLLNRIATIQQLAFVAVDVSNGRFARSRCQEARIVGKHSGLAVQLANVNNVGPNRALVHRKLNRCAIV